jgi:dipeptidyl aminopeptidase/acylaminoacyl peptidase
MGATAAGSRFKAVVLIAAVADPAEYVRGLGAFFPAAGDAVVHFVGGTPEAAPERYEALRGLSLAAKIRQPVLLIHGAADMRVPVHNSIQPQTAFQEAGNPNVTLEVIPIMGHYFETGTLGYQFDHVMDMTMAWLAKKL